MRVARYWAKAGVADPNGRLEVPLFTLWRGSDLSQADAQALADRDAADWRRRLQAGETLHDYDYAAFSRPEPLVEDVLDAAGERIAAITINRVGCSVLNTMRVAFVDVDLPPAGRPVRFSRLLGRRRDPLSGAIERLRDWAGRTPGVSARVYRTYAGLRYLLTTPLMDPGGPSADAMFAALGADRRYAVLCRAHTTFRARLSPKPHRLPVGSPPAPVKPDNNERLAAAVLKWQEAYDEQCLKHAVCDLIDEVGPGEVEPDAARVVDLHDQAAGVGSGLPLA